MISRRLATSISCISPITSFSRALASCCSQVPAVGRGAADEKRAGGTSSSGKGFLLAVYGLENVSFRELASLSPQSCSLGSS